MADARQTLLIEFSYPGWPFHGLQPQPDRLTAGGTLLELLDDALGERGRGVAFAARTDRFVSADQNFATLWFRGLSDLNTKLAALPGRERHGLRILSGRHVERHVNARNTPIAKRYRYAIEDGCCPDLVAATPLLRDGASWTVVPRLDVPAMQRASQLLLGSHDFSAFRVKACSAKTTVRTLHEVSVERTDGGISVDITGDGFLRKMIRIIVGTLAEVGAGLRSPVSIEQMLTTGVRPRYGFTAPGHGLRLVQVFLPELDAVVGNRKRA